MAVILYKAGNMTKVNGIPCEVQICNEFSYLHLLEQGWCYTPEECYVTDEPEEETCLPEVCYATEEPPEAEEAEPEAESEPEPENNLQTLRAAAKDAGIEKWQVKGMKRLEKELAEIEAEV